ncbi:putative microfibril-associated/Pre-mRNA processing [Lyophyllum shimeji]|uniref:Microfibril-associated/Pre-mRNA processing n=1 Tax=Lyophyllum shimeji TaxID=47721 RepID=A0A9P3PI48_LYOSH|nr:putative microfibril-associated/Pre-mRNA processing [Lyophyllum shimeji]
MPRQVKVAVIGTGLAGLTAAYLLSNPDTQESDVEFEVHLFEKASTLGMDCSSISCHGDAWRVDVPMRSFQGGYYPQLIALYKRLGVAFREADFSYSFSLMTPPTPTQERQITATMIYNGSSGLRGLSMPSILDEPYRATKGRGCFVRAATRAWTIGLFVLVTMQIAVCYVRMLLFALPFWRGKNVESKTFGEWAEETVPRSVLARWTGVDVAWRDYTQTVLLPLFSAVCTAPGEDVLRHPVEEFLDYIWLTLGTHHYVVVHGVRDVVSKLTATARNIHLSSTISSITPDPQDPRLAAIHCHTPQGPITYTGFHHIIMATQATRAIPLLTSYRDSLNHNHSKLQAVQRQIECLEAFEYRDTVVVNHTDSTLLPDDPNDRRELNLICIDKEPRAACQEKLWSSTTVPSSYTMATHVLRRPQGYPIHLSVVYQTTNPIIPPREETVLSVAKLERAVVTVKSKAALKGLYREEGRRWWQCAGQGACRMGELQGAGRLSNVQGPGLWICGSYAYAGIPLLEGCVVSARTVVEKGVRKAEGVKTRHEPW